MLPATALLRAVATARGAWLPAGPHVELAVNRAGLRVAGDVLVHRDRAERAAVGRRCLDVLHLHLQAAAARSRAAPVVDPGRDHAVHGARPSVAGLLLLELRR